MANYNETDDGVVILFAESELMPDEIVAREYPDDAVLGMTRWERRAMARDYADYASFDHSQDGVGLVPETMVLVG